MTAVRGAVPPPTWLDEQWPRPGPTGRLWVANRFEIKHAGRHRLLTRPGNDWVVEVPQGASCLIDGDRRTARPMRAADACA